MEEDNRGASRGDSSPKCMFDRKFITKEGARGRCSLAETAVDDFVDVFRRVSIEPEIASMAGKANVGLDIRDCATDVCRGGLLNKDADVEVNTLPTKEIGGLLRTRWT